MPAQPLTTQVSIRTSLLARICINLMMVCLGHRAYNTADWMMNRYIAGCQIKVGTGPWGRCSFKQWQKALDETSNSQA
jgi:hypothetical protein